MPDKVTQPQGPNPTHDNPTPVHQPGESWVPGNVKTVEPADKPTPITEPKTEQKPG